MTTWSQWFSFNHETRWVTGLFFLYVTVVIFTVSVFGAFYTVTTPLHALVGAAVIIAFGLVGLRASRMFGGSANFTGKLMLYYSLALFAQASSWVVWPFITPGRVPVGVALVTLGIGSLLGQALAAFALFTSTRAVLDKLNKRTGILIIASLGLSVLLSRVEASYFSSGEELLTWSVIWPILMFLQLAAASILVSQLGRWYLTKSIGMIAFGLIGYNVSAAMLSILRISGGFPLAEFWVLLSVATVATLYLVALGMSQAKPMKLGSPDKG